MSKVIESPVKRFSGTVTLPEFLTFPQATAWERAVSAASGLNETYTKPDGTEATRRRDGVTASEYFGAWVPGILSVVEAWNIAGLDPERFPSTPRVSVVELLNWLIGEIAALYNEAEEIPNE